MLIPIFQSLSLLGMPSVLTVVEFSKHFLLVIVLLMTRLTTFSLLVSVKSTLNYIWTDQEWVARVYFEWQLLNADKDIKQTQKHGGFTEVREYGSICHLSPEDPSLTSPRTNSLGILSRLHSWDQKPDHQLLGSTGWKHIVFRGIWTVSQECHQLGAWHRVG